MIAHVDSEVGKTVEQKEMDVVADDTSALDAQGCDGGWSDDGYAH